jgi:prevent-host-death family protein
MVGEVLDSNRARTVWRELLDRARAGMDTVIERYGKPTAALIPYEDYEALQEELEDLRAGRRAEAALAAYRRDPRLGVPLEQVEEELRAQGLVDD